MINPYYWLGLIGFMASMFVSQTLNNDGHYFIGGVVMGMSYMLVYAIAKNDPSDDYRVSGE